MMSTHILEELDSWKKMIVGSRNDMYLEGGCFMMARKKGGVG